jgi:hypothetical protein
MHNVANCMREQLRVMKEKNENIDQAQWKKSVIEAWNLYEDGVNLVGRTQGLKAYEVGAMKRELVLLLEMDERWNDMEEAAESALESIRHHGTLISDDNVEAKLKNILDQMKLVQLGAIATKNAGQPEKAKNEITDELLALLDTLQGTCRQMDVHQFEVGLNIYREHCIRQEMPTTTIDTIIESIKAVHTINKEDREKQG